MKNLTVICLVSILLFSFVGCAPEPAVTPTLTGPSKPSARAPWEEDWERTLIAAKAEGKVFVYSGQPAETNMAVGQAFEKKFGISYEYIGGRSSEVAERVLREYNARVNAADFLMHGQLSPWEYLKPAGVLAPLEPLLIQPEVLDRGAWWVGELPFIDRDRTILGLSAYVAPALGLNTEMVKPEEIKSYRDLLHPKWKGKVMIDDPTVTGSGRTFTQILGAELMKDWGYLEQLAKHEPVIIRDRRLLTEWLARGKYPIGLGLYVPIFTEFRQAGAPIVLHTPQEGIYLTPGSAVIVFMKGAPHPNAAKIFVNWLLSKEGQTIFSRAHGGQSARVDVPTEGLDPAFLRRPGVNYYNTISEDYLRKQDEFNKRIDAIFKPLVR